MKHENPDPIESCSPSEIRHLLFIVLSESKSLQLSYNSREKESSNKSKEEQQEASQDPQKEEAASKE